jgi:sporulation protein YabP
VNVQEHDVIIRGRQHLELTGVTSVDSFDEERIFLGTTGGALALEGEEMHITGLDLEAGRVTVTGKLSALVYRQSGSSRIKGKNIVQRLLK